MSSLYLINETFTNGFNYSFLDIISLAAIFCGIFVIISKNPIVSVLFLIGLFLAMSGYLIMISLNFLGLSYLLVYVGAVSILFLFILMLINVRISELVTDNNNSVPLAVVIGILFNTVIFEILPNRIINNDKDTEIITWLSYLYAAIQNDQTFSSFSLYRIVNQITTYFVTSSAWDKNLAETSHITSIGNILYTSYPLWIIITSMILLLAMVGAIVITIKPTKAEGSDYN